MFAVGAWSLLFWLRNRQLPYVFHGFSSNASLTKRSAASACRHGAGTRLDLSRTISFPGDHFFLNHSRETLLESIARTLDHVNTGSILT